MTTPTAHDQLDSAARASEAHHLPAGWREVRLPGVAWPVVIGAGGVYVLFARDTAASFGRDAAWHGERRQSSSGAQLTAALVSQLLSRGTGWDVRCTPVVVIDDDAHLAARPDEVTVLHRRRLTAWLAERPFTYDQGAIDFLVDTMARV